MKVLSGFPPRMHLVFRLSLRRSVLRIIRVRLCRLLLAIVVPHSKRPNDFGVSARSRAVPTYLFAVKRCASENLGGPQTFTYGVNRLE